MNPLQATLLDALRVFAAQMVLIGHIYSIVLYPGHSLGIGDLGVVIFFVLSGFLIVYTTLNRLEGPGYGLRGYLTDRFCRVFVPYLPALLCILAMDSAVRAWAPTQIYGDYYKVRHFVASLLMLQQHPAGLFIDQIMGLSVFKLATFGSARPLWTVAVEWWLYVTFGLLLFGFQGGAQTWPRVLALMVALPVPLFNMVAGTGPGLSLLWCMSGGLAWLYWRAKKAPGVPSPSVGVKWVLRGVFGVVLLLFVARLAWTGWLEHRASFERLIFYDFNLYVLIIIGCAALFLLRMDRKDGARNRVTRFAADYSYSLYLIHYSFIVLLHAFGLFTGKPVLDFLIFFVACNVVSVVFWFLFERHYRRVAAFLSGRRSLPIASGGKAVHRPVTESPRR
ncbi:MAG: acyltransferase [Gammaproteobacteria bacterium]|nr:acyltransferase [Gammaproteobacteria bacterium]MBU0769883.1 acyltransferase [Gammaproteobacteria bacterium]MBU0854688.1 acyltransferase [Gammaproteobacteria bacterium]MBU1845439.1 acyltransferase [Gammaproteobacteria bacterium]